MTTQSISKLIDHLFRHESGKIVSVLTRIFGTENLDLAEDVMQDSLVEAMKQWTYKGVPENPSAWLFRATKKSRVIGTFLFSSASLFFSSAYFSDNKNDQCNKANH